MSTRTPGLNESESRAVTNGVSLDPRALAGAAAVIAAVVMLLLGVFGALGIYDGAVAMMQEWHLFFEPTAVGTAAGMIEAAAFSFVFVAGLAWIYNELAR